MIEKITKLLFLASFFLLTVLAPSPLCGASGNEGAITATPAARSFNKKELTVFKAQKDFAYIYTDLDSDTWWDRLKRWFNKQLYELLNPGTTMGLVMRIVFYLACGAIVVYALLKLMGIDTNSLFSRNGTSVKRKQHPADENIHVINLETMLAEALQQQEYRKATRVLYLMALKSLSEKELIHWQPGKTNHEYYRELGNHPSEVHFKQLGYYFEYTWYGNFTVSEVSYQQISQIAESLQKQIKAL